MFLCPVYLDSLSNSSDTCNANSLVGVRINACGQPPWVAFILLNMMEPYVPVLPVPVCACASMSLPPIPTGTASTWMGVGSVQPISSIALTMSSDKPNLEKSDVIK